MSSRYFFGENADRPIRVGKVDYPFTVIGRSAGTAQGVMEIKEETVEAFLAVAQRYGVEEITREAYDAALLKKNKTRAYQGSIDRVPQRNGQSLKGARAVVVSGSPGASAARAAEGALPEAVEDAVLVASATTAPVEAGAAAAPARRPRGPRKTAEPAPAAAPVVTPDADGPL